MGVALCMCSQLQIDFAFRCPVISGTAKQKVERRHFSCCSSIGACSCGMKARHAQKTNHWSTQDERRRWRLFFSLRAFGNMSSQNFEFPRSPPPFFFSLYLSFIVFYQRQWKEAVFDFTSVSQGFHPQLAHLAGHYTDRPPTEKPRSQELSRFSHAIRSVSESRLSLMRKFGRGRCEGDKRPEMNE